MADDISQIMVLRDVQFRKHHLSIYSTKDGMFIEVREVQSRKHSFPKLCTEEGMTMEVREVQPLKQWFPNNDTDEGMSIEVREVQPSKQQCPKYVIEDGRSMDVREVQEEYLLMIDVQWFVLNTVEKWRYRFYLGSEAEDLTCLTFVYIKMNSTI